MRVLIGYKRTEKKIRLIQLQELTGIGKTTLNNMENEKTSPTLRQLERIAEALDCHIVDLFESRYK